jgi:hypothetical protein
MSPDMFGLTFHVSTPLQDSVGIITPSSLHYVATHRGSFVPEIDPRQHRFMIHGMVDRPLTFTMDELKRLPAVSFAEGRNAECRRIRSSHRLEAQRTQAAGLSVSRRQLAAVLHHPAWRLRGGDSTKYSRMRDTL